MLLASPNHLARSPPVSQNLTHVNNPGIIANASAADLRKLFTEPRNRLFTSSESALVDDHRALAVTRTPPGPLKINLRLPIATWRKRAGSGCPD